MPNAVTLFGHEAGEDPIGIVGNPLIVSLEDGQFSPTQTTGTTNTSGDQ